MSTSKKNVVEKVEKNVLSLREEMRTFGEAVEGTVLEGVDKWLTPEFWTMVTTSAGNVIAVMALLGWLDHAQVETVTKAITALIGASQVILINGLLVWKYLAGRQAVRQQIIAAKIRMVEDATYARLRGG